MEDKFLYHYTNFDTLTKIISNKTFRFTSLLEVDDNLESDLKEYSNLASFKFISCWSNKEKEDINFWRTYTGNIDSGIRIKMKTRPFTYESMLDFTPRPDKNYTFNITDEKRVKGTIYILNKYNMPIIESYPQLIPVTYTDNTLLLDEKLIMSTDNKSSLFYETKYIGWFKNKYWEQQEEVRYIISLGYNLDDLNTLNNPSLSIQDKDKLIKKIILPNHLKFIDLTISDAAIESMEILLSPTFSLEKELYLFLESIDLNITIHKSVIPTKW